MRANATAFLFDGLEGDIEAGSNATFRELVYSAL